MYIDSNKTICVFLLGSIFSGFCYNSMHNHHAAWYRLSTHNSIWYEFEQILQDMWTNTTFIRSTRIRCMCVRCIPRDPRLNRSTSSLYPPFSPVPVRISNYRKMTIDIYQGWSNTKWPLRLQISGIFCVYLPLFPLASPPSRSLPLSFSLLSLSFSLSPGPSMFLFFSRHASLRYKHIVICILTSINVKIDYIVSSVVAMCW